MTRTAICHTLSALAMLALVSACVSKASSAEQEMEYLKQEKWPAAAPAGTPWAKQIKTIKSETKERSSGNGRDDGWSIGVRATSR